MDMHIQIYEYVYIYVYTQVYIYIYCSILEPRAPWLLVEAFLVQPEKGYARRESADAGEKKGRIYILRGSWPKFVFSKMEKFAWGPVS